MKRGDQFRHSKWIGDDKRPLLCVVTRVAQGVIYWRPVEGGKSMYFPASDAALYVLPA